MNIDGANPPGTFRLNARSPNNQTSNSNSVNGTLFTSFRAIQRYKVRLYAIDIHEVHLCYESGIYAGAFRLGARFLYNQTSNSNSINTTLCARFLATKRYRVRPYVRDIHGVAQLFGLSLFLILLDSDSTSSTVRLT